MRVSLHKAWTKVQERTGGSQIHITNGNPSINSKATTFRETLAPLVPLLHRCLNLLGTVFVPSRFKHLQYLPEAMKKELLSVLYQGMRQPKDGAGTQQSA